MPERTNECLLWAQSGHSRSGSHQIGTLVKLEIVQSAGVGFILRFVDLGPNMLNCVIVAEGRARAGNILKGVAHAAQKQQSRGTRPWR
jgi:hypothetical protein